MKFGILCRLGPAIALAAVGILATAGPARATEIAFGGLTPSGTCGTATNSTNNEVCANGLTFTSGGNTFTASGYKSDTFGTATALTFKPNPPNAEDESGLGENAASTGACTDTSVAANCEIAGGAAVVLMSTGANLIDALIGSVQSGENFSIWTGSSLATLTNESGTITGECSGSAL
ncbi:MAG: hypothetical protein ACRELF_28465, partial [Gemmataceae bacterium]